MLDLYAAPTSNGLRAKIMLDELGIPYTLHKVDMMKGEHKSPDFKRMNPNGAIPVLIDSDGPGGKPLTVTQSIAIMEYACEKAGGKFLPKDAAGKVAHTMAVQSAATDMGMTLASIFGIARSKEPHKPSQEIFEGRWKDYCKVWDQTFAKQKYAAGGEVTLADFALYAVYARCKGVNPALCQGFPNLDRWEAEIGARPGTKKGMNFG
ncbi:MAG: glutathione S-transferase family protein [Alphaproteobacteria bacterium]|nr:glutathione S-transferase family protein [Alphaproteobacteria bacterium]